MRGTVLHHTKGFKEHGMLVFTRHAFEQKNYAKASFTLEKDGEKIAEIVLLEHMCDGMVKVGVSADKSISIIRKDAVNKGKEQFVAQGNVESR